VTDLSETQVVNWATNTRKRNMKATIDKERKPHHFLDYLFLATDREKQIKRDNPNKDFSYQERPQRRREPPPALPDAMLMASMKHVGISTRPNTSDELKTAADLDTYLMPPPANRVVSSFSSNLSMNPSFENKSYPVNELRSKSKSPPRFTYPRPPSFPPPPPASHYQSQYTPQHDIYHRSASARSRSPKNSNEIFRSKKIHNLDEIPRVTPVEARHTLQKPVLQRFGVKNPGVPPLYSFDEEDCLDPKERLFRMNERQVIHDFTAGGIVDTPPGSFSGDDDVDGSLKLDDIDISIFEEFYIAPDEYTKKRSEISGAATTRDQETLQQKGSDLFSVEDVLAVPFDESESYLIN
jgi:hypothetical protein